MVRFLTFLVALVCLAGCNSSNNAGADQALARKNSPYEDIVGFVKKLNTNTQNHSLKKWTYAEGKIDEVLLSKPDFARELALFLSSDLQKPAWQGQFQKTEQGLLTSYTATAPKPELRLLVISRDSAQRIRQIDVTQEQDNYLFSSKSSGSLFVAYDHDKPLLDSLSLSGEQKIIFGAPFAYNLVAKVQP